MATVSRAARNTANKITSERFVRRNRQNLPENTWIVFTFDETGKRKRPRVFEGNLSRDQVRAAYSRTFDVPFWNTRSRRVENY